MTLASWLDEPANPWIVAAFATVYMVGVIALVAWITKGRG